MIRFSQCLAAGTALCMTLVAFPASAACQNKFAHRNEGSKRIFTLLTGKLTFPEARNLSKAIAERKSPGLQWVNEKGKPIATQYGELKVIRPMPVGCDDRKSGVVMNVTFTTIVQPAKKVSIKLDADRIVDFDLTN